MCAAGMDQQDEPRLLRIGVFSRLSTISVRMLRHYQDNGILEPETVDPFTGHRYYRAEQLVTAHWVVRLRDAGFRVAEIAEVLAHRDDPGRLRQLMANQHQRIAAERLRVDQLEEAFTRINTYLEGFPMEINVRTETIPAHTVAAVRRVVNTYADEGVLWQELGQLLPASGAAPVFGGLGGATFHDPEYREADVDVEVWVQVAEPFEATPPLACQQIPARDVVLATLKGSYDAMPEVTAAIGAYIAGHGLHTGPMFNIYHVSPAQNPDLSLIHI